MSFRIQITTLLISSMAFFSCSPKNEESAPNPSVNPQVVTLTPRTAETEPEPIPQLVVLFEFEGIPQSALNAWIGERNLKIIQQQLELNEQGLPVTEGDLYILSPRLITQFIEKDYVAPWNPEPDLADINPIFTSHSFDFNNAYAIPWRWTPMVLLQHRPDPAATEAAHSPESPSYPDDPVMIASLQSTPPQISAPAPSLPNPDAYRASWETFIDTPNASVWIPAACPLRNTSDFVNPEWTWSLPQSKTTIVFDHLLVGARSELKPEASELLEYLLSSAEQNYLITTTGYFPVICPLGKETAASPIPLPKGNWLNKSTFITMPAYTPPAAPESSESDPAISAEAPEIPATTPPPEDKATSAAPAPETSPAPETTPPAQTAY